MVTIRKELPKSFDYGIIHREGDAATRLGGCTHQLALKDELKGLMAAHFQQKSPPLEHAPIGEMAIEIGFGNPYRLRQLIRVIQPK